MRKSRQEAAKTREAIVRAAADLIRSEGLSEVSVANVMAAAGLTHGGFYRHFRDRDQLVAEATASAGDITAGAFARDLDSGGRASALETYLSISHRDATTPLCTFAAAGSELARASAETRQSATEVLERIIARLAKASAGDADQGRADAIVDLSTMIGAMTLSRIVSDEALSREILDLARARLLDRQ
ncbi:MAG TPA: TetR family transcriptional regulator [Caulobacteraceae bacterium]|jgi:TetR/AcrR family transcriptional repressor of nem operon